MYETSLTIIFVYASNPSLLSHIHTNIGFIERKELEEAVLKASMGFFSTGIPESLHDEIPIFSKIKREASESIPSEVEACFGFADKYVCTNLWRYIYVCKCVYVRAYVCMYMHIHISQSFICTLKVYVGNVYSERQMVHTYAFVNIWEGFCDTHQFHKHKLTSWHLFFQHTQEQRQQAEL